MKKVYYPTETFNEDTQGFYKTFEVSNGFPTLYELVEVKPAEDLKYPKFNRQTGKWETDSTKLIEDLMAKQDEQGAAMLEAINSVIGGESNVSAN